MLFTRRLVASVILLVMAASAAAEPLNPSLYSGLRWRMIGPFRGGRTVAVTGVPGKPNLFYMAPNNGGVWKSDDYGRTWHPIFDDQPTGSIGALAVAPSNPEVIYVGSGEGIQRPDLSTGDGVFKSTDGGKTWKQMGLADAQQIGAVAIDPRDPNRVYVAVLGHPYGSNAERGVFRSIDGGRTWEKVLYKNENTGAIALVMDPANPKVLYADLFASRQGPWENGAWSGPECGVYKSTDGGDTWKQLTKGLPTAEQKLGRVGLAIAPSDPNRLYAVVDAPQHGGIYRSDDGGESWRRTCTEQRLWGRGFDFAEVRVRPGNKDDVWVANTSTYRSTDGGNTFHAVKGAPGGDDYHTIWFNPDNPDIIILGVDQGATISVNGGKTWSSWYNQPTAQFYHVITDNQFPYWVYGAQQESGSAGVASRGGYGQVTHWDWHPVGIEEYGYVAPDPLNPDIIYGGKVERFDRSTGQVQSVSPQVLRFGKYRFLRTAPLLFSPVDPHVLYLGANVLFKTTDGGHHWDIISPDLSRERPEVPESIGVFRTPDLARLPRRGVIYTVAPSYKDVDVIWAGTDDGLVHVTRNGGKSWQNVTPPGVTAWSKISLMDAGHFDADTAYAAVNRIRLDDQRPHVYRTHDGGKTWQEIVRGLPANAPVNAVREDPQRRGLLFCGTERAVFVSFNDGDDWQSLRQNMPAISIRDLVVHEDDLIVGTHGRSFWILDDLTPLRQVGPDIASSAKHLFRPQLASRVRWNVNTDTPLPPEEPAGPNPPDGAVINYYLKDDAPGPLTIDILDHDGKLVRRYASTDTPEPIDEKELDVPTYWIRPSTAPSTKAGMQRFVWDLHYPPPEGSRRTYEISAVFRNTASSPPGPWVIPGEYTVKLTVNGQTLTQPLTVRMDPRVRAPAEVLSQQFALSMRVYEGMRRAQTALKEVRKLRAEHAARGPKSGEQAAALTDQDKSLAALEGTARVFRGIPPGPGGPPRAPRRSLSSVYADLTTLLQIFQAADATPTTQAVAAAEEALQVLQGLLTRWQELKGKEAAPAP